jgi:hypothetical protein
MKKNYIVAFANEAINRQNAELNAKIYETLTGRSAKKNIDLLTRLRIRIRWDYSEDIWTKWIRLDGPNGRSIVYGVNQDDQPFIVGLGPGRRWAAGKLINQEALAKVDFVNLLTNDDVAAQGKPIDDIMASLASKEKPEERYWASRWKKGELPVYKGDILATYAKERRKYNDIPEWVGYNTKTTRAQTLIRKAGKRAGLVVRPGETPRIVPAKKKK